MNTILRRICMWLIVALGVVQTVVVFGRYWWIADLLSHFRLQYALGAFVLLCAALLLRQWSWAGVAGSLLALNLALIIPLPAPELPALASNQPTIRVAFSNIHIWNNDIDRIEQTLSGTSADVVVLAEISLDTYQQFVSRWTVSYPYHAFQAGPGAFGIAVFSRSRPIGDITPKYFGRSRLPSLVLRVVKEDSRPITIVGTHPIPPLSRQTWQARNSQLYSMAQWVKSQGRSTIIVGDFNNTPWSPTFWKMLQMGNLYDSRRGQGIQQSWPTWLPQFMRLPIDHALATANVRVVQRQLGSDLGSDHLPIVVDVALLEE